MKKINFAFIGCSQIAIKHLESIKKIENANLVAVCDINYEKAKQFAEKINLTTYYSDYNQMMLNENIDVVVILTPSGTHAKIGLDVAKYKKHIIIEKPLALRVEEADELIKTCKEIGINLFVVKQNRFNKPIQALKKAILADRFGKFVLGTVRVRWCREQKYYDASKWKGTWKYDGGVICNQASHHIDMLTWLLGEVECLNAFTSTRLVNIEAEDTAVVNLKFINGSLGIIEATTASRPIDLEGSISILGEKGSVVIGGFAMDKLMTWEFSEKDNEDESVFSNFGENPKVFAWNHTEYYKNVIDSLLNGSKPLVDGLEGRKSIELINAIYESTETEKTVYLKLKPIKNKLGI